MVLAGTMARLACLQFGGFLAWTSMSALSLFPLVGGNRIRSMTRRAVLLVAISLTVAGFAAQAAVAQPTATLKVRVAERVLSPTCQGKSSHTVAAGASLCFEIAVKVLGPGAVASGAALTGVTLTDQFPFSQVTTETLSSGSSKCTAGPGSSGGEVVSCSISAIPENKDALVTLTSAVPANAARVPVTRAPCRYRPRTWTR
jgi:hypothetical protein